MREFIIADMDQGQRFDKYLKRIMPLSTTGFLYKMLRKKNITLNHKKAEGNELLQVGDVVNVFFQEETFLKFGGKPIPEEKVSNEHQNGTGKKEQTLYKNAFDKLSREGVKVLGKTEDLIVLYKPNGILSQKAKDLDISMNEWLLGYILESKQEEAFDFSYFKPSICNRLDRNTSGIVLGALTLNGARIAGEMLKRRTLHKYYITYVHGCFLQSRQEQAFLYKNKETNTVTVYKDLQHVPQSIQSECKPIETGFKPLLVDEEKQITKLEVALITGKSHQIRAHLAHLGFPLVGDVKYGGKPLFSQKGQVLHAYRLVFPDRSELKQFCGKEILCPLPDAIKSWEDSLCLHGIQED